MKTFLLAIFCLVTTIAFSQESLADKKLVVNYNKGIDINGIEDYSVFTFIIYYGEDPSKTIIEFNGEFEGETKYITFDRQVRLPKIDKTGEVIMFQYYIPKTNSIADIEYDTTTGDMYFSTEGKSIRYIYSESINNNDD